MNKVYLVEDCKKEPGRTLAVFLNYDDACDFVDMLEDFAIVIERTVFYGQPSNKGYNK